MERPFDFIREDFWREYPFASLEQGNADLHDWLAQAAERVHGTTREVVRKRFEREQASLSPLPQSLCDVSLRLTREVRKDCRISVEGNFYLVSHQYVGKHVIVRLHNKSLRIYHDNTLLHTYVVSEEKGQVIGDSKAIYAAVMADRALNARKYAHPKKGKATATISPTAARYPVEVTQRPLTDYDLIGGGISNA